MSEQHRFCHRVRYAEIDQMGVAYHSRYLEWFEAARTEMLREMGLPYAQLEKDGIMLPVIEAHCQYIKPVRYDDSITITTQVEKINRIRLQLNYSLMKEEQPDTVCATGTTVHCFVNADGRPVRAEKALVDFIKCGP